MANMTQRIKHALMDFKTAYFAAVIFSFVTYVSCNGNVTSSSNVTTVQVNNTAKMEWNVVSGDGRRISVLQLFTPGVIEPLISGVSLLTVLRKGKELFGERITAIFNATGHNKYIAEIRNVQYRDSITFQLVAIFRKRKDNSLDGESQYVIRLDVTGSPSICGQGWKSNYTVRENATYRFSQVICGHPKPICRWKVGAEGVFQNSATSNNIDKAKKYNYTFEKKITRKDCGKLVVLNAKNFVGSEEWYATIYVAFTPSPVSITDWHKQDNNCINIIWARENTGACVMNYYLQFDGKGDVYNTFDKNFTQCNLPNASNVAVWASYRGINGSKTTKNISESAPPTTTTKTTVITSKNTSTTTPEKNRTTPSGTVITSPHKGNNIGLIVGIVGGILFLIIVIFIIVCVLKHKKKNGTGNHSGYAMRMTGEENNYVTDPTHSNRRQPANPDDPEQAIYSELGPGGGRTGPRPAPEQSDYAEMKVDAMGYPIDGAKASEPPTYAPVIKPREGAKRRTPSPPRSNVDGARAAASSEPPAYAPIMKNRSSSRGRSPPPDEDDHEGVIV